MISSRHMLRKRSCQKKQVDWLCSGKTKKVQVPTLWKEKYAWDHRQKLLKHWRAENTTKSQKTNSKAICLHEKMPPKSPTSDPCQVPDCRLDDSPCAAGLAFKNCTASAREACKSTSVKRLNKNATQSFPRCHPQLCVRISPQRCHWRAPNVRGDVSSPCKTSSFHPDPFPIETKALAQTFLIHQVEHTASPWWCNVLPEKINSFPGEIQNCPHCCSFKGRSVFDIFRAHTHRKWRFASTHPPHLHPPCPPSLSASPTSTPPPPPILLADLTSDTLFGQLLLRHFPLLALVGPNTPRLSELKTRCGECVFVSRVETAEKNGVERQVLQM